MTDSQGDLRISIVEDHLSSFIVQTLLIKLTARSEPNDIYFEIQVPDYPNYGNGSDALENDTLHACRKACSKFA